MANQTIRNIDANIAACETILSYTFTSESHLLQALNNSGCPIFYLGTIYILPKNDALAVLGDARMAAIMCRW
ncbi:hypothetical protein EJ02DRAFT_455452 [Clathrospora elynae]|uniref:Uncharacterized protein n=1 Tax=Clathrospora elynae TaxID=706981 RepID=A0A6A5SKH2_9PLEO|nr:hypothetical protein EJ02DRAFT_455452 [Clathrospora elynae]